MTKVSSYSILLLFIGLAVYSNTFFNGFVWDDAFQIVNNGAVHSGDIFFYFSHTIGPYYRPLMLAIYTLIFQLFGLKPFFYHLLQVSIHITNSILVLQLFNRFSKHLALSFFLSLVFLIHPMNSQIANYVANLQDALFIFFGLGALLISAERSDDKHTPLIAAGFLILGLFSKETGALFVLIYIVFTLLFTQVNKTKAILLASLAFVTYFATRLLLVGPIKPTNFVFTPENTIMSLPLLDRLLSTPKIILFYLTNFIIPLDLTDQYWFVRSLNFHEFFAPLLLVMSLLCLLLLSGIYIKRESIQTAWKYYFFVLWFLLGIGFHLQLLPLDKTASDRWFCFPMIGLLGIICIFIQNLNINLKNFWRQVFYGFLVFVLFGLAIRTFVRNFDWVSDLTLFSRDIKSMENVGDILFNYGTALMNAGQYYEARNRLVKASEIYPNSYQVWHNLGITYLHTGEYLNAQNSFSNVLKLKNNGISGASYVLSLLLQFKYKEAKETGLKMLTMWQYDANLWRMLGLSQYYLNDFEGALNSWHTSYGLAQNPITRHYLYQLQSNQKLEIQEL